MNYEVFSSISTSESLDLDLVSQTLDLSLDRKLYWKERDLLHYVIRMMILRVETIKTVCVTLASTPEVSRSDY